jgi:hypothetical protein
MSDAFTPPETLTFDQAQGAPEDSAPPASLTYDQAHGPSSGAGQPGRWERGLENKEPMIAGSVAALAGAAHSVPFAEDIAAGANTVRSYLGGHPAGVPNDAPIGERFDAAKRAQIGANEALRGAYPVQSLGGELLGFAGSAATAPMKALAAGETALAGRLAPMIGATPARMASSAAGGAGLSGLYGAGEGSGGISERAQNAGRSLIAGGALGAAMPAAGAVLSKARDKILPAIPLTGFAETIGKRQGDEAVEEALALAKRRGVSTLSPKAVKDAEGFGMEIMPIDVAGTTGQRLAKTAINASPEAEAIIKPALTARAQGQQDRLHNFIAEHIYSQPGRELFTNEGKEKIRADAADYVSDAYKSAYAKHPALDSSDLTEAVGYSLVQKAIPKAVERLNDALIAEGKAPLPNPFVKVDGRWSLRTDANGDPTGAPLQLWDYVKRELSSKAAKFKPTALQPGDREKHAAYATAAKQIADALKHASPDYRAAASGAGKYLGEESAWNLGPRLLRLNSATDLNAAEKAIAGLTDAERVHLRDSYMQERLAAYDKLRASQNIGDKGLNEFAKRKDRIALGPEAANKLHAYLMLENLTNQSLTGLGGSDTAKNLLAALGSGLTKNGALVGMGVGAEQALSELANEATSEKGHISPARIFRAFAIPALAGHMVGVSRRVSEARARQIAELLVSKNPKTVEATINLLARKPRMMKAISSAYTATQAAIANTAATAREARASGGAVDRKGALLEKALGAAQRALADESKALMHTPDEAIAEALRVAACV